MRIVDVRKLDDSISVAPQIGPADVTALAAMGFTAIINNRPDGEEMGQPDGAAIEAVATTLGVDYVAIPVTHAGFSHPPARCLRRRDGRRPGPGAR